jgi:hypothetical protein
LFKAAREIHIVVGCLLLFAVEVGTGEQNKEMAYPGVRHPAMFAL